MAKKRLKQIVIGLLYTAIVVLITTFVIELIYSPLIVANEIEVAIDRDCAIDYRVHESSLPPAWEDAVWIKRYPVEGGFQEIFCRQETSREWVCECKRTP